VVLVLTLSSKHRYPTCERVGTTGRQRNKESAVPCRAVLQACRAVSANTIARWPWRQILIRHEQIPEHAQWLLHLPAFPENLLVTSALGTNVLSNSSVQISSTPVHRQLVDWEHKEFYECCVDILHCLMYISNKPPSRSWIYSRLHLTDVIILTFSTIISVGRKLMATVGPKPQLPSCLAVSILLTVKKVSGPIQTVATNKKRKRE
jgi:hypothetical protein